MYNGNYNYHMMPGQMGPDQDRFLVPFLLGGLGGAAVVGLSRPRPVYVNPQPYYGPAYPPRPYPYGGGYGYSNYNYYY